jgi:hypothetical protein
VRAAMSPPVTIAVKAPAITAGFNCSLPSG